MSVQSALGITAESVDRIISRRLSQWVSSHDELPADIHDVACLQARLRQSPQVADRILRILAMRGHVDHLDDAEAASVLAYVMLPAAILIARQLYRREPEIDTHVAAHLWIQSRTTPWTNRGAIAVGIRWRVWKGVTKELALPAFPHAELNDSSIERAASLWRHDASDDETLTELLSLALRSGDLTMDEVDLLHNVLEASVAVDGTDSRGAALLGQRVSSAVAPIHGADPRTIRRHTRSCIDALRRLASA